MKFVMRCRLESFALLAIPTEPSLMATAVGTFFESDVEAGRTFVRPFPLNSIHDCLTLSHVLSREREEREVFRSRLNLGWDLPASFQFQNLAN